MWGFASGQDGDLSLVMILVAILVPWHLVPFGGFKT